ncbi:hypothetical protein BB561_004858 [Smittium simulii]|uniref:DNA polymerase V n=1 Tax=Smittium simulii TaxID=133385 RepID=A0A2T9YDR8_9FUNG|nr:hypothetical protein BB561_004858 [Smittium simulii]
MSSVLDYYWGLADLSSEKRLISAKQLISALSTFQKEFELKKVTPESQEKPAAPVEARTEDQLNLLCCEDLVYALKRLIKGLTSSRDAARQGFFVALVELLISTPVITAELVLSIINKVSAITQSKDGQEQRDMWFGKLFAILSIAEAGLISSSSTTSSDLEQIIAEIAELSIKRDWISEAAYNVLHKCPKQLLEDIIVPKIFQEFIVNNHIDTPDKLKLVLGLKKRASDLDWSSLLPEWKNGDFYSITNRKKLEKILLENVHNGKDSFHPHIHTVWESILLHYFPDPNAQDSSTTVNDKINSNKSSDQLSFMDLWECVVDNGFFASSATKTRKYWGFQLTSKALLSVDNKTIPQLFSKNMIKTMLIHLTDKDRSMHGASQTLIKSILNRAESSSEVSLALVEKITSSPSSRNFDKITKTKTVSTLMSNMTPEVLINYADYLINIVTNNTETVESLSNDDGASNALSEHKTSQLQDKLWAIDQLVRISSNQELPRSNELIIKILEFFISNAYFTSIPTQSKKSKTVNEPISNSNQSQICSILSERIFAFMGILMKLPQNFASIPNSSNKSTQTSRNMGIAVDGEPYLKKAIKYLTDLESNNKKVTRSGHKMTPIYFNEKESIAWRKNIFEKNLELYNYYQQILYELSSQTGNDQAPNSVVEAKKETSRVSLYIAELTSLLLLQKLSLESNISALLLQKDDNTDLSKTDLDTEHKNQAKLLSMQTELKELGESIEEIQACIQKMLPGFNKKIEPRTPQTRGRAKAKAIERAESDQNLTFSEEHNKFKPDEVLLDLLVSMLTKPNATLRLAVNNLFSIISSSITETGLKLMYDVIKPSGKIDKELQNKLGEILGEQMKKNADNSDEESEEEDLLDDDQMEEFDEKLASIFKHKKQQSKEKLEAEQNVLNFKMRILDLFEIYFKAQVQRNNILVLYAIQMLVPAMSRYFSNVKNANLYNKLKTLLVSIRKYEKLGDTVYYAKEMVNVSNISETQVAMLTKTLKMTQKFAKKSRSKAELEIYSSLNVYASKFLFVVQTKINEANKIQKESANGTKKAKKSEPKTEENKQADLIEIVQTCYSELATDFFGRKNSKLQLLSLLAAVSSFKQEPFNNLPWELAKTIAPYTELSKAINGFKLVESYTYFVELIKTHKFRLVKDQDGEQENEWKSRVFKLVSGWLDVVFGSFFGILEEYSGEDQEKIQKAFNGQSGAKLSVARLAEIIKSISAIVQVFGSIEFCTPKYQFTSFIKELVESDNGKKLEYNVEKLQTMLEVFIENSKKFKKSSLTTQAISLLSGLSCTSISKQQKRKKDTIEEPTLENKPNKKTKSKAKKSKKEN